VPGSILTLLTGGGAAAAILCIVLVEALLLYLRWRRGVGAHPHLWLSQVIAGGALVTALLLAQRGAPAESLGAALVCAGVAHLAGYRTRWNLGPEQ